jgi:hypothetical protein
MFLNCDNGSTDNNNSLPEWVIGNWKATYYGTPHSEETRKEYIIEFTGNGKMTMTVLLDDSILQKNTINVEVGKGMYYDGINSDLDIYEITADGKIEMGYFSHYYFHGEYQLIIYLDQYGPLAGTANQYPFIKQ